MNNNSLIQRLGNASMKKVFSISGQGALPPISLSPRYPDREPISQLDRAGSTDNASSRPDNQRCVDETGALKDSTGSFCHSSRTVNHAGVTARGFRLVKVEPRDSKSSERFPFGQSSKRQKSMWFLFATGSNPLGHHQIKHYASC